MISCYCIQTVDGASIDANIYISNHLHGKPTTTSPSTLLRLEPPSFGLSNLFRSDLPLPDYKKIEGKLVGEFL